jgi:hypothetical protein
VTRNRSPQLFSDECSIALTCEIENVSLRYRMKRGIESRLSRADHPITSRFGKFVADELFVRWAEGQILPRPLEEDAAASRSVKEIDYIHDFGALQVAVEGHSWNDKWLCAGGLRT